MLSSERKARHLVPTWQDGEVFVGSQQHTWPTDRLHWCHLRLTICKHLLSEANFSTLWNISCGSVGRCHNSHTVHKVKNPWVPWGKVQSLDIAGSLDLRFKLNFSVRTTKPLSWPDWRKRWLTNLHLKYLFTIEQLTIDIEFLFSCWKIW